MHARRADRRAVQDYFTNPERAEAGIKLCCERKGQRLRAHRRNPRRQETVVSYNASTSTTRDRKLRACSAAAAPTSPNASATSNRLQQPTAPRACSWRTVALDPHPDERHPRFSN